MLTVSDVSALLNYDPDTGVLRWRCQRGRVAAGSSAGNVSDNGYVIVRIHGKNHRAHRLGWLLTHGVWPSKQIDHVDGDRANNRLSNLREATNAENQRNARRRVDNTSGAKGVTWHKQHEKWNARIFLGGAHRSLGLFADKGAAIAAYEAAASQHFKEFARTA